VTGYYGPATLQLVQQWQSSHGVISSGDPDSTGYGYVGPKTRAAMSCGGQTTQPTNTYVPPTTYTPPPTFNTTIVPPAISATVNSAAFSTSRPAITGTASGLSGVRLSLNIGSRVQYSSPWIAVAGNGAWSHQVTEAIPPGAYHAVLTTADPKWSEGAVAAEGQIVITGNDTAPSITFSSISSGNVIGSFANLPANSQIRFVNATSGQRYDAQSTMVWSGGSGPLSIAIPNDLPNGTYYLRATDYYNPNTTIAQSASFQTGSDVQTKSVTINQFTASPSTINAGQAVMFMWGSNLNSTDISYYGGGCSIEGLTQNNVALQVTPGFVGGGTVTYVPPATATYTLRCSSGAKDGSPSATKQITVNVGQPQTNPVVISSFTPSQTSVTSGQPVTFTWNSNLTNNDISYYGGFCSISALTSYNQQIHITSGAGASGSVTYTPALTATYTLACSAGAKDGSPMDTEQVAVSVN